MAYDEGVAQRLQDVFSGRPEIASKKMFGGLALMYRGHMLLGILGDCLMARVGPELYEAALARPHAREMDFNGKPMKGYVFVDPPGYAQDENLQEWVGLCLRFNESMVAK